MEEKKDYCLGCDEDFYNGKNPHGIKECWHLKDARIMDRYRIGIMTPQDRKENFTRVRTLSCFTSTGLFAYYNGIPDHLK